MSGPALGGIGFRHLSFGSKLRLVLTFFLMSWLLFFSLLAWFFVRGSLHEQVDSLALNQLIAASNNLDERLNKLENTIKTLANALSYQWGPEGQPPGFATTLLQKTLDDLDSESTAGVYLASEGLPAKHPDSFIWYRHARGASGSGSVVRGGQVRFDFHNATTLTSWYHRPKASKKPYLSEPYFDLDETEEKVVSMSAPVIDSSGKFRGVVGIDIRIEAIEAVRRKLKLYTLQAKTEGAFQGYETGFVCSPQGRILAHPDSKWLPSVSHPFGFPVSDIPFFGEKIAAKSQGYEVVDYEGQAHRITWTLSPIWGWKLVLIVPESVLNQPITFLGLQLLCVFLIGSVFAIFLVGVIATKMSEPLELLRKSAQANSTQSPRVHALALRTDEIGMVVRWLLRLSEHASEQDSRNRVELMRAFRLELARQLSGLRLDLPPEAAAWGPDQLSEEFQKQGYPVESGQIHLPTATIGHGERKISIQLSDDIAQDVIVTVAS